MKFELEEYRRNISEKELVEDLKHVTSKLKKDSVTIAEYNKLGKFHDSTLRKKFGSTICLVMVPLFLKLKNSGPNIKTIYPIYSQNSHN